MKNAIWTVAAVLVGTGTLNAQDWPQWRGPDRTAKAVGFMPPKDWPKELTQKWKVPVGEGVASPALVGDKIFVFGRQGGDEVVRCLNAADGKEVWQDKYAAAPASGAASSFPGPRSSPVVADGRLVTLGVQGTLSCYEASGGKLIWRKDDFKGSAPRFFVSSSPMIMDGLCIAQMGGDRNGAIEAYDLATGKEKWKWAGDGTAYASPSLLTAGNAKVIVAETAKKIVGVDAADGKLLWETPFAVSGRGYNAASPMVEGEMVIGVGSSRGVTAVKLDKKGNDLAGKELWSNKDNSCAFNTPVVKDKMLFGLSDKDKLFCINTDTGKTAWTSEGIRGSGGKPGYGSIVDAGAVLFALSSGGDLIVFEPTDKQFKQLAKFKVGTDTYAYPIISGNKLYVKEKQSSLVMWVIRPEA